MITTDATVDMARNAAMATSKYPTKTLEKPAAMVNYPTWILENLTNDKHTQCVFYSYATRNLRIHTKYDA